MYFQHLWVNPGNYQKMPGEDPNTSIYYKYKNTFLVFTRDMALAHMYSTDNNTNVMSNEEITNTVVKLVLFWCITHLKYRFEIVLHSLKKDH